MVIRCLLSLHLPYKNIYTIYLPYTNSRLIEKEGGFCSSNKFIDNFATLFLYWMDLT